MYDGINRSALCKILLQFDVSVKLVRIIKLMIIRVRVQNMLTDPFACAALHLQSDRQTWAIIGSER